MSNYKISKESIPLSGTKDKQIIIRLKTGDGQYRQYSYIQSENDKPEEIADLETEIGRFLASTLRK